MSRRKTAPYASEQFAEASRPRRKKQPLIPYSIKFTLEERRLLDERAGGNPLSVYIRSKILGDKQQKRRRSRKVQSDDKLLAQLLAELGRSHLPNNLNQIAKSANMGTLPISHELEAELWEACNDIKEMRRALFRGLRLQAGDDE